MAATGGDGGVSLAVDVLVVGGGVAALYIARALHGRYSVCVLDEPSVVYESYESSGRISAGYTGNDPARIQPARRSAGYWRLWAESNEVPRGPGPDLVLLRPEEEAARRRVWADAALAVRPALPAELPAVLAGGSTTDRSVLAATDNVVLDPARLAAELRAGLEDRIVAAEVLRFGMITDEAVDFVEAQLADGRVLSVTPRFVVLASDVANGRLLQKMAAAFKDRARRKEAVEATSTCQAVRRRPTIVIRGALPPLAGHFEGLDVTSLPLPGGDEHVWVVQLPIDDTQTVTGPEDVRFPPSLDPLLLTGALDRLFALCPALRARADELQWAAFVARKTEHPMMAGADPELVAQPSPAKLEALGMDTLVAAWPSHLGYSMIVGDVVAERVTRVLGEPGSFGRGPTPADLPRPAPGTRLSRWQRPGFGWHDWETFAKAAGFVG